jgi:hypothetical protein
MMMTMPRTSTAGAIDYYEVAARQVRQQILPSGLPDSTLWSYGSINHAGTFHSPAPTFEARLGRVTRVKWINGLVDASGGFRRHLLPIDQTLHWANPPGPRDGMGTSPQPYKGPVPLVSHLHGGHTFDDSDGYPEAWFLPTANDIPAGMRRKAPGTTCSERRPRRALAPRGHAVPRPTTTPTISRPRRCGFTTTRSA